MRNNIVVSVILPHFFMKRYIIERKEDKTIGLTQC